MENWKIERPGGRVTTKGNMNGVVNQVPSQPELSPQLRTGLSDLTRYEVAHSHGNNFNARRYFSGFILRQPLNYGGLWQIFFTLKSEYRRTLTLLYTKIQFEISPTH